MIAPFFVCDYFNINHFGCKVKKKLFAKRVMGNG